MNAEGVDRFTAIPKALEVPHIAFEIRRAQVSAFAAPITDIWPLAGDLRISSDGLLLQIIDGRVVNHFKPSEVVIAPILGLDKLEVSLPAQLRLKSPARTQSPYEPTGLKE